MFFNSDMLTKRGPLARVWMASHLSAKLSKSNLLATSIPSSVKSILGNDDTLNLPSMALRLSGQLLLGVARIYSRKTKYLLDDCNETLSKVKKAFRPGAVDMEENDASLRGGNTAAITLGAHEGGLEDILNQQDYLGQQWDLDMNARQQTAATMTTSGKAKTLRANTMNVADITLPDHSLAWGDDRGLADFDFGEGGGLESQVDGFFDEDFELGIMDDGNLRSDGDISVEAGRDAAVHASDRGSIGPFDLGDLTMDKVPRFEEGQDMGGLEREFEPWRDDDLNREYGGGFDREKTPNALGDLENDDFSLTPKTLADLKGKAAAAAAKGAKKARRQVIDASTELPTGEDRDMSRHLKEPSFLPRSRLHLRLLELERDASLHLPAPVSDSVELFAPAGLASELEGLYAMPTRRERIRLEGRASSAVPDEVELGRKRLASLAFEGANDNYDHLNNREYGGGEDMGMGGLDVGMDFDASRDDFRFELEEDDAVRAKDSNRTPRASPRKRQRVDEDLAAYAAEEEGTGAVSKGPLAVFDSTSAGPTTITTTATQTQSLGATEEEEVLAANGKTKWSKNTVKAVNVLSDELNGDDDATLEFSKVAQQVTKKAAASFFFELLVLSTRDCVKIEQPKPYGEIEVQAREKLWNVAAEVAAH